MKSTKEDKAWALQVKRIGKWRCAVCKLRSKRLQAHHIFPRHIKRFRLDILNGIVLCFNHHKVGQYSAHNNALWFSLWLKKNRPAQYEYLINEMGEIGLQLNI